jgi:catechol 2,3-dioxygenase-like lactoylglutathione lyase family enzyme
VSTLQAHQDGATDVVKDPTINMSLEVIVIPVADVDRALRFYRSLGWRLDADYEAGPEFRIVQVTPPGSVGSVIFGRGVTPVAPGSAQGLYLVVFDIDRARADLVGRGVDVSEVFHNVYDNGVQEPVDGPDPERRSYASYASFSDPDGNGWLLQEVQVRLPGR